MTIKNVVFVASVLRHQVPSPPEDLPKSLFFFLLKFKALNLADLCKLSTFPTHFPPT